MREKTERDERPSRAEEGVAIRPHGDLPRRRDGDLSTLEMRRVRLGLQAQLAECQVDRSILLDDLQATADALGVLVEDNAVLLAALKGLRALIRDLGVQDADDSWNEAVERADVAIANADGGSRGVGRSGE